jgi:hypothetical protein
LHLSLRRFREFERGHFFEREIVIWGATFKKIVVRTGVLDAQLAAVNC